MNRITNRVMVLQSFIHDITIGKAEENFVDHTNAKKATQ
ncbi:hypothetical protein LINPERHAP2_LOCUS9270, partial [Linum perenne]